MAGSPVPKRKSEQGLKATLGESGLDAMRSTSNVVQPAGNQAAFAVDEAERKRWNEEMGFVRPAEGSKLDLLLRATKRVEIELISAKELRNTQEEINNKQKIVSSISAGAGSVWSALQGKGLHGLAIPSDRIWDESDSLLSEVRSQIATRNIIHAAHALANFVDEYTKARTELNEYLERVSLGTGISITGLEAVRAIGAIAASIASGGIAAGAAVPMLGITAGTGLGLLGTSVAVGAGAGVYGLAQETAGQGGEMIADTREEFDFKKIAMRGGKDAILGFVGTLTGGALSKYAANYFGRILMQRLKPDQIAAVAERLGVDAAKLTPAAFLGKLQTFVIDFFAGVGTTPLMSAVEIALNKLEGEEAPSPEEFAKMVIKNAVEGGLLQLFLAPLMHGASRKPKSSADRSISLGAPVPEAQRLSSAESTAELQATVKRSSARKPLELPDAPAEFELQSAAESTADLQSTVAGVEPIETGVLPNATAEAPLQSVAETTRDLQAQAGEVAGTENMGSDPISSVSNKPPKTTPWNLKGGGQPVPPWVSANSASPLSGVQSDAFRPIHGGASSVGKATPPIAPRFGTAKIPVPESTGTMDPAVADWWLNKNSPPSNQPPPVLQPKIPNASEQVPPAGGPSPKSEMLLAPKGKPTITEPVQLGGVKKEPITNKGSDPNLLAPKEATMPKLIAPDIAPTPKPKAKKPKTTKAVPISLEAMEARLEILELVRLPKKTRELRAIQIQRARDLARKDPDAAERLLEALEDRFLKEPQKLDLNKGWAEETGGPQAQQALQADAAERLSLIDRLVGRAPINSEAAGLTGEAAHAAEVVALPPRRAASIYPESILSIERERLLRGEISLGEFARMFPEEGASQVRFGTSRGDRIIDHMYLEGDVVVLRESKNVLDFRLPENYRLQLDKDLEIVRRFSRAKEDISVRVEWRITGNVSDEVLRNLILLEKENPGRFSIVLGAL